MRPDKLTPLFKSIQSLPGIGEKLGSKIKKLIGGDKVKDIIFYLPVSIIDRRLNPKIRDVHIDHINTLRVTIGKHAPSPKGMRNKQIPYRIHAYDETGSINLIFFHAREDYLKNMLPEGSMKIISGKIEKFGNEISMPHPDYIGTLEEEKKIKKIEPVYPLSAGLSNKRIRETIEGALKDIPELPEWITKEKKERLGWKGWHECIRKSHAPQSEKDVIKTQERQRLAYDEILADQLALGLVRQHKKKINGMSIKGTGELKRKLINALHFHLTQAQERVIKEIEEDLESKERMTRLLQGDVGSGKTIIALLAAAKCIEEGGQVALMAPTEILVHQHHKTIEKIAQETGMRLGVVTGKTKKKEIQEKTENGEIDLLIGTHALFQEGIRFKNLLLSVIDEQHRFGVQQRLTLTEKGKETNVLVMSATPIPRTLALSLYGDMDISRLEEMPPGRKEIDTRLIPLNRLDEVIEAVKRALEAKEKIYWVCPLVEETDKSDLAAAVSRQATLEKKLKRRVNLIHGRMKNEEKEKMMSQFMEENKEEILVATTVIEVGINVPEANIMIIEHAERFGLSQLHQLRGRVGRGTKKAVCILLYNNQLSEIGKARLRIMKETNDGFKIAEEDLKIRGIGELLGTKQSGLPLFKVARFKEDYHLFHEAYQETKQILQEDPFLKSERGEALRHLLYLFEKDKMIKIREAG